MFTGLIETTGTIVRRGGNALAVRPARPLEAPARGESIAVNGCCLTLERRTAAGELEFFTLDESLRRTALGALAVGDRVNLERAMIAGARLDGHIVQGHVDAALKVLSLGRTGSGDMAMRIELPAGYAELAVEKGSVAVDGVSLTVAETGRDFFTVRLIPVTRRETALETRRAGESVNLEFDVLGRYIRRQLELRETSPAAGSSAITMDTLREAGFL